MKKKIAKKRQYKIVLYDYEDGTSKLTRLNEGFNAFEILGILERAQQEIIDQISGRIKPTVIERKVKI